jgi:hypothetical protein
MEKGSICGQMILLLQRRIPRAAPLVAGFEEDADIINSGKVVSASMNDGHFRSPSWWIGRI